MQRRVSESGPEPSIDPAHLDVQCTPGHNYTNLHLHPSTGNGEGTGMHPRTPVQREAPANLPGFANAPTPARSNVNANGLQSTIERTPRSDTKQANACPGKITSAGSIPCPCNREGPRGWMCGFSMLRYHRRCDQGAFPFGGVYLVLACVDGGYNGIVPGMATTRAFSLPRPGDFQPRFFFFSSRNGEGAGDTSSKGLASIMAGFSRHIKLYPRPF